MKQEPVIEDIESIPRPANAPSATTDTASTLAGSKESLAWALRRLAQSQGHRLDGLRLSDAMRAFQPTVPAVAQLMQATSQMGLERPQWMSEPDAAYLPLLCITRSGFGVVLDKLPSGQWLVSGVLGEQRLAGEELKGVCALVNMRGSEVGFGYGVLVGNINRFSGFIGHVYKTLRLYRTTIIEACVAGVVMSFLALATSLFSMQVYDRVIPTRSEDTLVILASGVVLTILLELAMKFARSHLMDRLVVGMDNRLSREIFSRLLSLRIDQMPASVGSLAGQVRGYEQVRSFYTASSLFTIIEIPMGVIFLLIIMLVGHPAVAAVPLVFGLISIALGLTIRRKIMRQAQEGAALSNLKTGLLVEAVEGMETIKAGSGGWKFLSRWVNVTNGTIQNDLKMRAATESIGYLSATIQQISYAGLIVAGALVVMQGKMTMGALIACSILSGRVLAPVMAIPGLLVQHAHAKAALEGLEKIYQLKVDNQDVERALTPDSIRGHYQLVDAKFAYADNPPALIVPALEIRQGERVAILGPIGAGKSTLLRLLSGMYQPVEGRVLLDGLDLAHLHRQVITEHVGYLQQEHRLFQGSLRENLLVGLPDPGDEAILEAMRRTGMDRIVAAHPKGLERAISEGGKGLSGGQKQLVAFTRLVLTNPEILLLDEPTATMDDEQERRCLLVLAEEAKKGKTLVFVTHKSSMLPLATRVIVIVGNKIMADGPRDEVLQRLQQAVQPVQPVQPVRPEQAVGGNPAMAA